MIAIENRLPINQGLILIFQPDFDGTVSAGFM